jgi:hypothetical protein
MYWLITLTNGAKVISTDINKFDPKEYRVAQKINLEEAIIFLFNEARK